MVKEWRPVVGYEGYYEVSSYGDVRSVDRYVTKNNGVIQPRKGHIKKQRINRDGYYTVKLSKDHQDRRYFTHRLVADAFLGDMGALCEVDHIDCDRSNNQVDNLQWVTRSDNIARIFELGHHYTQQNNLNGECNPNYGNHTLSERYQQDKEYARTKQSRPGAVNGRACKVSMFKDGVLIGHYDCFKDCAAQLIKITNTKTSLENAAIRISYAAKQNKKYKGYQFVID